MILGGEMKQKIFLKKVNPEQITRKFNDLSLRFILQPKKNEIIGQGQCFQTLESYTAKLPKSRNQYKIDTSSLTDELLSAFVQCSLKQKCFKRQRSAICSPSFFFSGLHNICVTPSPKLKHLSTLPHCTLHQDPSGARNFF